MSVCPSARNSVSTGRIFIKFDIRLFLEKSIKKIQVSLNLTIIAGSSSSSSHFIFHKSLQDVEIVIGNNQRENNKQSMINILK